MNLLKPFRLIFQKQTQILNKIISRLIGVGVPVTNLSDTPEAYVRLGYMANLFVHQAVSYITNKASRVPIKLYSEQSDGTLKEIKTHPILDLINKPNYYQGKNEFVAQALGFKLITGNSYIYTPKLEAGANKGKPYELQVLPAHMTRIISGDWRQPIAGYQLEFAPDMTFPPEEVIHIRYEAYDYLDGDYYGLSPLKPLLNIINKSNANILAAKSAFEHGGAAGILTDEPEDMGDAISAEQAKMLESRWGEKFAGAKNKNKILVTVGRMRYQQIGLSPVDLNMLSDHEQTRRDICATYQLSSMLFNDTSSSTYNNVSEARKAAWTDAIQPLLDSYLDELTRSLAKLWGEDLVLKADYSAVAELQQDMRTTSEWLQNAYWMTASEKRKAMGLPEDDTMNVYFIPSSLIPFEDLPPMAASE